MPSILAESHYARSGSLASLQEARVVGRAVAMKRPHNEENDGTFKRGNFTDFDVVCAASSLMHITRNPNPVSSSAASVPGLKTAFLAAPAPAPWARPEFVFHHEHFYHNGDTPEVMCEPLTRSVVMKLPAFRDIRKEGWVDRIQDDSLTFFMEVAYCAHTGHVATLHANGTIILWEYDTRDCAFRRFRDITLTRRKFVVDGSRIDETLWDGRKGGAYGLHFENTYLVAWFTTRDHTGATRVEYFGMNPTTSEAKFELFHQHKDSIVGPKGVLTAIVTVGEHMLCTEFCGIDTPVQSWYFNADCGMWYRLLKNGSAQPTTLEFAMGVGKTGKMEKSIHLAAPGCPDFWLSLKQLARKFI